MTNDHVWKQDTKSFLKLDQILKGQGHDGLIVRVRSE